MKKALLSAALSFVIVTASLFSASCGGADNTPETQSLKHETEEVTDVYVEETTDEEPPASEPALSKTIVFGDGHSVTLGDPIDSVLAECGEPLDVFEAPNCVDGGIGHGYTFSGYTVTTYSDQSGNEYAASLDIMSSETSLENGVAVGSPLSSVFEAYGDGYTEAFGTYTYEFDGFTLTVVSDNDTVVTVSFALTSK